MQITHHLNHVTIKLDVPASIIELQNHKENLELLNVKQDSLNRVYITIKPKPT